MSFLDNDCKLEETQRLEFKEAQVGLPDDIWETYSAFANTEGGEIVLGVSEPSPGRFLLVGVPNAPELEDAFWRDMRNTTKVERDVMFGDGVSMVSRDGLDFLVISVPRAERGDKPVRVYDRRQKTMVAWVRRGSADKRATESDLNLMTYDKASSADRRALERYGLDDLCPQTISRYRAIFTARMPQSPWVNEPEDDFLFHIGAAARGNAGGLRPTRAGLLAFGQEYIITDYLPHYLLDYREEVSGTDRWDDRVVSQSGGWSGNIVDFYLDVTGKLKTRFKAPFGADEYGTAHVSRNPITEAINEALVNALVHAYYGDSCTVSAVLGADKLVVTNPGGFLIDRDVALAGGISETRNPTLMRILSFIGAGDRAGSGLQKIWRVWWDAYGEAPVLEEAHSPSAVRLSLPISRAALRPSPEKIAAPSVSADEFVEFVNRADKPVTANDAQVGLGVSLRVAQKRLKQLADEGVLRRERRGTAWVYLPR